MRILIVFGRRILTLITFVSSVVICQGALEEERVWTGSNGRSLRGSFHRLLPDGKQVEIVTPQGKLISISLQNLCEADRKFILNGGVNPASVAVEEATGDPKAFKPTAYPNRDRIVFVPLDENDGAFANRLAYQLWISMLWWDAEGLIPIPSKGDPKLSRNWLHRRLARIDVRDRVTLEAELKELYAGKAVFRTYTEKRDLSPKRLSELASGPNLVTLWMRPENDHYWMEALISSVAESGDCVMFIDGKRLVGAMKVLEAIDPDNLAIRVAFHCSNPGDFPKSLQGKPPVLLAETSNERCVVIKPYILIAEGAESPPPPDPGFPVCVKPAPQGQPLGE